MRVLVDVLAAGAVATAVLYWWIMLPLFEDVPRGGWPVAAVMAVVSRPRRAVAGRCGCHGVGLEGVPLAGCGSGCSWALLRFYGAGLLFLPVWYAETLQAPYPDRGWRAQQPVRFRVLPALHGDGLPGDGTACRESAAERWPVPQARIAWLSTAYPVLIAFMPAGHGLGLSFASGISPRALFIVALTGALALLLVGAVMAEQSRAHPSARVWPSPIPSRARSTTATCTNASPRSSRSYHRARRSPRSSCSISTTSGT